MSAESLRVQIECARARGWDKDQTAIRLGCSTVAVCLVWTDMDVIAYETDKTAADRREIAPCGTRSAAFRHRRYSEPLDAACRDAEHEYNRDRMRRTRGRRAA